jgi:hypothetical protein
MSTSRRGSVDTDRRPDPTEELEPVLADLDQVDGVAQFDQPDGGDQPDIAGADHEDS